MRITSTFSPQVLPQHEEQLRQPATTGRLAAVPAAGPLRPRELAVGDHGVLPPHGVVEVVARGPQQIDGTREDFFGLRSLLDGTRLWIPVRRIDACAFRPLTHPSLAAGVLATLRSRPAPVPHMAPYKWHRKLYAEIYGGSLEATAAVLRDLRALKQVRALSPTERRIHDYAHKCLVLELALTLNQTREQVEWQVRKTTG